MNIPQIVYKFRDWKCTYHRNILYRNEIYLASPADFNDPFDCRIIPDYSLLDTREKKIEYLMPLRPSNSEIDIEQAINNLEGIIKNPDKYEKYRFQFDDKHLVIFCVTTKWDIIPLWSNYANFHTGFCVGFNLAKLSSAFPFSKMGKLYYNKYPSINPADQNDPDKYISVSFKKTHYKSNELEYENEFRLTRFLEKEMNLKDRLIYLSDECIVEITLGLNFPVTDISEVKEIASQKKWALYHAQRIPMKFGLTRERIE